jgi:hypothetical protein
MIAGTTLADTIKRNADTTNLQANVFLTPISPSHVRFLANPPRSVDVHGRSRPFMNDGM